jgi:hypothetical protein
MLPPNGRETATNRGGLVSRQESMICAGLRAFEGLTCPDPARMADHIDFMEIEKTTLRLII